MDLVADRKDLGIVPLGPGFQLVVVAFDLHQLLQLHLPGDSFMGTDTIEGDSAALDRGHEFLPDGQVILPPNRL